MSTIKTAIKIANEVIRQASDIAKQIFPETCMYVEEISVDDDNADLILIYFTISEYAPLPYSNVTGALLKFPIRWFEDTKTDFMKEYDEFREKFIVEATKKLEEQARLDREARERDERREYLRLQNKYGVGNTI